MDQTQTLSALLKTAEFNEADPIVSAFVRFHHRNPEVFIKLKVLALRVKAAGKEHYSIAGLVETLRYETALKTSGEQWKLPNNFRALYARLLEASSPQLKGFFKFSSRRMKKRLAKHHG